jgi:hypothetical protein
MNRVSFAGNGRVGIASILLVGLSSALLSGCSSSLSDKPFIGVYEESRSDRTKCIRRESYDGKGRVRIQQISPYKSDFVIADLGANNAYYVFESRRAYYPAQTQSYGTPIFDAESARLAGAKPIGTKKIGAYKCHGWLSPSPSGDHGGPRETWTSDEYNLPVLDRWTDKNGVKVICKLKAYEGDGTVDGLFKVPDDYRQVSQFDLMTGFLQGYQ